MISNEELLQNLYDAFNRREIETVLSTMKENVKWANGMEGGFAYGRDNVRQYWRKQFETFKPQLTPLKFEQTKKGVTSSAFIKSCAIWRAMFCWIKQSNKFLRLKKA